MKFRNAEPLLLITVACLVLAAPARPQDDGSGPQVYRMEPATRFGEKEWREFQERHEREFARVRRMNERYAEQATPPPIEPIYNAPGPRRPPRPIGPSHPPVMRDFRDDFAAAVKDYVDSHSKGGAFAIDDALTGRRYELKLSHIHTEKIRTLSSDEVSGDAGFDTTGGPKGAVDLDFFLHRGDNWSWAVEKVLVRAVNGRQRYAYDPDNRIVAVATPQTAPRVIPKPTAPAHLSAEVSFSAPGQTGILEGGETGTLQIKVDNAGPGPAYAISLSLDPRDTVGVSVPAEVELGDLPAGKSLSKEVPVTATAALGSGKVGIRLTINEANGFDTEPILVEIQTRAYRPAKLELAGLTVGGTGIVAAGEPTKITVRVRNLGPGIARAASAALTLGGNDLFMSGEPTAALGDIAAGQTKAADFEFFANKRAKAGLELPVSLTVTEASGQNSLASVPLHLVLGQSAPALKVVTIKGTPEAPAVESGAASDDVDSPPRSRTPRNDDAYAVLVGIEKYRDIPAADFAARDAGAMQAYLTESMGFDPKNVILLQNERATLTDLTTYLGPWLKDHATAKSRVFVYYAGHGASDPKSGRSFLIPYDGDPAYTDTKAFPLQQLYDTLAQLPTDDVTVALDACFSGAGGRSVLAKGTRPLVTAAVAPTIPPKIVVLAASGGDQISTDNPDAQHGMLTYFLLKGLHGDAADSKGRVTTRRLFEFIKPAVERAAREQHVAQSPSLSPALDELGDNGSRVWLQTK